MLLKWLRKAGDEGKRPFLPQPTGVPEVRSAAVKAANDCVVQDPLQWVQHVPSGKRRKTEYYAYSAPERLEIAQYAADNGVARAARHFSSVLDHPVNESTIRAMKKQYIQKTKQCPSEAPLASLPRKKRGARFPLVTTSIVWFMPTFTNLGKQLELSLCPL